AALGLMSSCSAASRREAPPSTRATTRMRMSAEYAFGMVRPPDESMPPDSPIYRSLGILRFYSARTCSRQSRALLAVRSGAARKVGGFCRCSRQRLYSGSCMQIAQIALLTEATPPKLYGGTERVREATCAGTNFR